MPVQEITMPSLGMAPGDVYLAEWVVEAGATVAAGDTIALIETDKAELSLEAEVAGVLGPHLVAAGDLAPAGSTIGWVLEPGESAPDGSPQAAPALPTPTIEAPRVETSAAPAAPTQPGVIANRADRTRDDATQELTPYTVSPRQRAAVAEAPAATPAVQAAPAPTLAPVPTNTANAANTADRYRAAVARAVSQSWAEIPHFAVARELRVEKLQDVLRSFRILDSGITFTDILLKAYALALIQRFGTSTINLGLAVATPNGVAIPVMTNVATSDLISIAKARKAAVERALAGQLSADDQLPAHSTLSNLGAYGVDSFTAIVPLGQTSILSVGASGLRPVVEDGALGVGMTMHATLNVDHREWDGQHAALALQRLAAIAAEPAMLLTLTAN